MKNRVIVFLGVFWVFSFSGCKNTEANTTETKEVLAEVLEKGKQIALDTKAVLGKNLLGAIKNKGTENALEFCSAKAFPLTDSVAGAKQVGIKRVSDMNRNANNVADAEEMEYIGALKESQLKKESLKPKIKEKDGNYVMYFPIVVEEMCLQCHGNEKTEIDAKVLKKIKSLYPADKAVGYKIDDVRGIWSIVMTK